MSFFVAIKFANLKIILFSKWCRKTFEPIDKKLKYFQKFQKSVFKLSEIPWFGIQDPENTYPGFRPRDKKKRRIPDPQHCQKN